MQRPVSITVLGILNIGFALFGVFGIFATLALFSAEGATNNPVMKIIRDNPAYAGWLKISIPFGILACVALLACGVGLLMMQRWARVLAIGYSIYAILFGLIGVVINFLLLFLPLMHEASRQPGPEAAGAIGGAIGGTFGGCFGLIYPVVLLIFMTRPRIKAAFTRPSAPPIPPLQA